MTNSSTSCSFSSLFDEASFRRPTSSSVMLSAPASVKRHVFSAVEDIH